ncbi:hypothetical protein D3C85_1863910 [compost metagenome]
MRFALERMERILPDRRQFGAARQQVFILVGFERGQARGRGDGVSRIGIAVEELDDVFGPLHEGVVDFGTH